MVICLERGADLHMAQPMPLPLTVSRFSKIQIGFTFLVPAHPGSPGQRVVKRACALCVVYTNGAIFVKPTLQENADVLMTCEHITAEFTEYRPGWRETL